MSRKVTIVAPSNIAFLKYWGAIDLEKALPANVSLSMTLSRCVSRTTIETRPSGEPSRIEVVDTTGDLVEAGPDFAGKIERHLAALSEALGAPGGSRIPSSIRIATANTFPSSAGIASSASGFAALATAFAALVGSEVTSEELSVLARRSGSGSAARSVLGGYVEWPETTEDPAGPARQIAPEGHWKLCDVIAVVSSEPKLVSSRDGHLRATSSPYFVRRQELLPARLVDMRQAVLDRDLERLGAAIETEAIELHLVAMSSAPPIFYWMPETIEVLQRVWTLREEGVGVWATIDAGPNVHMICEPRHEARVVGAVGELSGVEALIKDRVGSGPRRSEDHLF